MADVTANGSTFSLDLPIQVPEFTLRLTGTEVRSVSVDGVPLTLANGRATFENNSYYHEGDATLVAFTPTNRTVSLTVS